MSTTELIVCTTCGYSDRDASGRTRGEQLQRSLARAFEAEDGAVEVRGAKCFMACGRGCNVHVRAPGKMGYLVGDLDPNNEDSVATFVDYLAKYRETDTGVVPYKEWPEGIGRHFICRVPPHDPPQD